MSIEINKSINLPEKKIIDILNTSDWISEVPDEI